MFFSLHCPPYKSVGTCGEDAEMIAASIQHVDIHEASFRIGNEMKIFRISCPGLVGGAMEESAEKVRFHVPIDDVKIIAG